MINFPWIVHVLLMDDSNTLSYIAYVIVVNRLHLHWSPSSSPPPIEGEKFIHWSSHHHFVIYRLVIIVSYCSSSLLLSFKSVCVCVFFFFHVKFYLFFFWFSFYPMRFGVFLSSEHWTELTIEQTQPNPQKNDIHIISLYNSNRKEKTTPK